MDYLKDLTDKVKQMIKEYIQSHVEIIDTENAYFKEVFSYCQSQELKAELEKQKKSGINMDSPSKNLQPDVIYDPSVRVFQAGMMAQNKSKQYKDPKDKPVYCQIKVERHEMDDEFEELPLEMV
jgi:hypothetical protein